MQPSYDALDPTFVNDLKNSHLHVEIVAEWLRSLGKTVIVRPLRIRPTVEERHAYADTGDLLVNGRYVVEAKQRMLDFTSASNYPYPTIIIDVAHHFESADPKPFGYVITNRLITHCALVRSRTKDEWTRTLRFDRHANRTRYFLECPKRLAEWRAL